MIDVIKPKPDKRLDWRSKNMPVLGRSGKPIDPIKQQQVSQFRLAATDEPSWRNDPTYNIRRKR